MKKVLILIIIIALASFTAYKLLFKKETKQDGPTTTALRVNKNSDAFNLSFAKIMNDYYSLRDAFVDWDTAKIDAEAKKLQVSTDSLAVHELKADSTVILTANTYVSSISNELTGLIGETSIEEKRHAFNTLTSEIYDLIRVVRYDHEVLYHIKCPMAFSDSVDGFWLSNTSRIVNPYLGKKHPTYKDKMLGCGEVVDSLDFSKSQ